jgi:hypothetical protein
MKTLYKIFPCVLIILCVLFSSCSINNRKLTKEIDGILSNSPNAIEAILEKLEYSDIIFVATSQSHYLLNDTIFLSSNLQLLYNAGVRYFFEEGAIGESFKYGWPKEKDPAYPYYPWDYAGIRYGAFDLFHEIYQLNKDKNEQDKIKIIGLQTKMEFFIPGTVSAIDRFNYRDKYMANIAINVIENVKQGEKIIINAGSDHGSKEIFSNAFGGKESWKPLGAYLYEKYKDRFLSLHYITLDENIKLGNDSISNLLFKSDDKLINSNEWKNILNTPKLVTAENAANLRKLFSRLHLGGQSNNNFDEFIFDKSGIKGVMFGYTLFDTDILNIFIEQTKELDNEISLLKEEDRLENITPDIYYKISYMIKYVYYLKLYFGDNFPYNFWNPEMPLSEAITILENNILSSSKPEDKMVFPPPFMGTLRDYHDYSYHFKSLNDDYWSFKLPASIKINIEQPKITKMKELFPYELWSEYWYAKMYMKGKKYKKAYEYMQIIINNPLVYSMQIYPEVLEMAIQCAENLGFNGQANTYKNQKTSLWNEYSIDVGIFYLFN